MKIMNTEEYFHHILSYYILISTIIGLTCSSITLSPSVTEVVRYVNESYIVTCIDANKQAIKWTKLQTSKSIGEKGHPHVLKIGPGTALVFERITSDDRGSYTCHSEIESATFKLIVISPITFYDTPSVQTAQENYPTTIKCDVRGDPKPKILWKFDGRDIQPPKYKMVQGGLKIENITLKDKGTYTCRAYQVSQITSMFEEKRIRLNVQHKPLLPNSAHPMQNEAYGFLGGEVNLTCEAIAEPQANFTWFRQHKKSVIGRLIQRPHISTLQLFMQNDSMFGGYMCKATNKLGSLNQIITLQKGIKPPKPQNLKYKSSTSDTISLDIVEPNFNLTQMPLKMIPTGYRVQYRIKGESIKWKETSFEDFIINSEDDKYVITGLNHNTDYEIRVASRNIAGFSDYTQPIIAKTLGLQADSVISAATHFSIITRTQIVVTAIWCIHVLV